MHLETKTEWRSPAYCGYTSQPSVAITSVLSLQNYTFSGVQPNLRTLSPPASPLFHSIIFDVHAKVSIPDSLPHFCSSAEALPAIISCFCPSAEPLPATFFHFSPSAEALPATFSRFSPSAEALPATFGASALFGLRLAAHYP